MYNFIFNTAIGQICSVLTSWDFGTMSLMAFLHETIMKLQTIDKNDT